MYIIMCVPVTCWVFKILSLRYTLTHGEHDDYKIMNCLVSKLPICQCYHSANILIIDLQYELLEGC